MPVLLNRISWPALIVALPLVYSLTLMWLIPEGEKYVPGFVLVVFLIAAGVRMVRASNESVPHLLKTLTVLTVAYTAYSLWVYFTQGDSWTEIRSYVTAAFYGGALWLVRPVRLDARWLVAALGLTFVVVGGYHAWVFGSVRLEGSINPIPLATVVGAATVAAAYLSTRGSLWRDTGLWVLLASGLFAVLLLTQTRGVILAVLMLAPLAAWVGSAWRWRGAVAVIGAAVAVMALALWVDPVQESVVQRYERSLGEIERLEAGDFGSSAGLRLQMLDAGARLVTVSPLTGLGASHSDELVRLGEQGDVPGQIARFDPSHYHNSFLDIAVKKGLIGLALFLVVMVVAVRVARAEGGALGAVVLATWAVYALAAMTDTPFRHPNAVYVLFFLTLFAASLGPDIGRVEAEPSLEHQGCH